MICPSEHTRTASISTPNTCLLYTSPSPRDRQQAVIDNANVFEVLMDAVRVCSLGQITSALFEVGGQYRRNM